MIKAFRELKAMAESMGVTHIRIESTGIHNRLFGMVDGQPISILFSRSKAFANARYRQATKRNLRIAIDEARSRATA